MFGYDSLDVFACGVIAFFVPLLIGMLIFGIRACNDYDRAIRENLRLRSERWD